MRFTLLPVLLALCACTKSSPEPGTEPSPTGSVPTGTTGTPGTTPLPRPEGLDPLDDLSGLAELACANGNQCAPNDVDWLGETCCAFGDPMEIVSSTARFIESVDIEVDDDIVVACAGFGAMVGTVQPDGALQIVEPRDVRRCERIAIGPQLENGNRFIYLAHHGDTTLSARVMVLWRASGGEVIPAGVIEEEGVLYEGLALVDGHLWVAAHGGGLRSYSLDSKGLPTFVTALSGFDNAQKIATHGTVAYVTDENSIKVIDATDPAAPVIANDIPTSSKPRDVFTDGTQVFVALGSNGAAVYRADGLDLTLETTLDLDGSVQAVHAHGDYVALAAWDHLALLERDGLDRVGGIKLKQQFEQTWGVAMNDDFVFGTEWFGVHTIRVRPGFVAPELTTNAEVVSFDASSAGRANVRVTNRGPLNLLLGDTVVDHAAFEPSTEGYRLRPDEQAVVSVDYEPPGPAEKVFPDLALYSNDPSATESPHLITLSAQETGRLDVGDKLPDQFSFLDPTGQDQLSGLEGTVTVLAYFALF